jgi:gliding motility-associated-like protein
LHKTEIEIVKTNIKLYIGGCFYIKYNLCIHLMKKIYCFCLLLFISTISISYAQRGKDGNSLINTANRIVNEYTILTADATAGDTSISVLASGLNANSRFSAALAPGDLILIIQMQGATILGHPDTSSVTTSVPNDPTWGSITNYNNCGKYELRQVASVPNSASIVIDCGLINSYTALGKVQIVRVPRFNSLTITAPGILTCPAWDGSSGGILAVEVYGHTTINTGAKMSATGKGFRGGALFTPSTPRSQTLWYSSSSNETSANKGEGIAGYDNDYAAYGGKYCRGAAANAGGAANVWNCGGGGGANAGSVTSWNGQGNPDTSVNGYSAAWNLEAPGFAHNYSSGGGRGGYSFSADDKNATTDPPNSLVWGGYARVPIGGLGGRPLDYSTGRIFMGGGGGGGEQDNNQGGAGGAGGGIIYFTSYGTVTGVGNDSVLADGNHGGDSHTTPPITSYSGKDGSGGAGGGGTILFNTSGIAGVILTAKGGHGGNQILTAGSLYFGAMNEGEGPGGGGGGGYIAINSGFISQLVDGGKNGTTNSDGLTEFTPNGATSGDFGTLNESLPSVDSITTANVSICSGDSTTLYAKIVGAIPATLTWYNAPTGGSIVGTDTLFATPVLTATTTYYVGSCPGNFRIPVVVTVLPSTATVAITQSPTGSICPNTPITFTATATNGGTTPVYAWSVNSISAGTNSATFTSSSLSNNDTVICMMTSNSPCAPSIPVASNAIVVTISPSPNASIVITSASSDTICSGTSVSFTATSTNGGSNPTYQWQRNGINTGGNSAVFSSSSLANSDTITCTLISNADCVTGSPALSNLIVMTVHPLPTPSFTSNTQTGCSPTCVHFIDTTGTTYSSVIYSFGDNDSAATVNPVHCYTQVGTFTVAIFCTDANNCTGTISINHMITVSPQPAAHFTVSPSIDITSGTAVTFTNTSSNATSAAWNFGEPSSGNENISALLSPSHTFTAAGTYCIELVVQNPIGCTDSTHDCIIVTNESSVSIPNVFTPNGDGNNDLFFIKTKAIKELDCVIYDRWGLKITEWNTVNGNWDGKMKSGKIAADGVYFYVLKATGSDEKVFNKQGFVELLK